MRATSVLSDNGDIRHIDVGQISAGLPDYAVTVDVARHLCRCGHRVTEWGGVCITMQHFRFSVLIGPDGAVLPHGIELAPEIKGAVLGAAERAWAEKMCRRWAVARGGAA